MVGMGAIDRRAGRNEVVGLGAENWRRAGRKKRAADMAEVGDVFEERSVLGSAEERVWRSMDGVGW
jgi:hypothetical protein